MSRHRNVRNLNYAEECEGFDDVYGHSVEEDFCCSPGTMEQYGYRGDNVLLSSFMDREDDIPEEQSDTDDDSHLRDSGSLDVSRQRLSDVDKARLHSCLEEMHNIVGESIPDHVMVDAVLKHNFDYDSALSYLLDKQGSHSSQLQHKSTGLNRDDDAIAAAGPLLVNPSSSTGKVNNINVNSAAIKFNEPKKITESPESLRRPNVDDDRPNDHNKSNKYLQAQAASTSSSRDSSTDGSVSTVSTPKRKSSERTDSPAYIARMKQAAVELEKEITARKAKGQDLINLVVIGHVDAGKSTLMGHVLFNLGFVQKKTMQKYEHEAKKIGKASFAYAWVLDETDEERNRGVTMDIAQTRFETKTKVVTLLDAPGHKDFIPNMITGAAQADCALLVVNATRGEFETGFDLGGQTREHAMLIRSLGVSQLVIAINKMDTVDWKEERFVAIKTKLAQFLKQAGFKDTDLRYVPCSGLSGENLTERSTVFQMKWYKGPTLVETIDTFIAPPRDTEKPLRISVSDVFKSVGTGGLTISGTLKAGSVIPGSRVMVQPCGEVGIIKTLLIDEGPATCAFAGDTVNVVINGVDLMKLNIGSIICDPINPIPVSTRIRARIVIFNIEIPITKGYQVVFHYQSLSEAAHIHKLVSQLSKSTGEIVKKKPRCLIKNSSAVVEISISRPICIELYKDFKDLGRFMLRSGGTTIAAGLVTDILKTKKMGKVE